MIDFLINSLYYLPIAAAGYGVAYAIDAAHGRYSIWKAVQ